MAFFGLTALGAQSAFQASALDFLDITLLTDEELLEAFNKCDRDNSGTIEKSEFHELLRIAYRGPPPQSEVDRMMDHFDTNDDGKVTFEEFKVGVADIKAELEARAKRRAVGAEPIQGRMSHREMTDARTKHVRDFTGPKDTLHHPVIGSQDIGWTVTAAAAQESLDTLHPRRKCDETKFAEKMYATGEFF